MRAFNDSSFSPNFSCNKVSPSYSSLSPNKLPWPAAAISGCCFITSLFIVASIKNLKAICLGADWDLHLEKGYDGKRNNFISSKNIEIIKWESIAITFTMDFSWSDCYKYLLKTVLWQPVLLAQNQSFPTAPTTVLKCLPHTNMCQNGQNQSYLAHSMPQQVSYSLTGFGRLPECL